MAIFPRKGKLVKKTDASRADHPISCAECNLTSQCSFYGRTEKIFNGIAQSNIHFEKGIVVSCWYGNTDQIDDDQDDQEIPETKSSQIHGKANLYASVTDRVLNPHQTAYMDTVAYLEAQGVFL